jgi:acetyl-CoA carboxylase/biotin carboxylase 1
VELVLDNKSPDGLTEVDRPIGQNKIGMVAWRVVMYPPEAPMAGREIILIANDITHQIGSFGPGEDEFFYNVSRYARQRGLPRIYVAANSGARIGLAQEVKDKFRVAWVDPKDPTKGFRYLYLTNDDYRALAPYVNAVQTGEDEWRLVDIIGKADGLGVENLRGSGLIAGETSRAYEEIFTLTLVTGRTVGIGAYLIRLGQRTVQNEGPIILTGAPALNKVLGREVYTSNVQLGGPQIMYANGVSHVAVNNELKAVTAILRWLSYVPAARGRLLPSLNLGDPIDRPVQFVPKPSTPYDPRHMLAGCVSDDKMNYGSGDDGWISGFFDRGSFFETLAGWAKTVVCGRARLGGIPIAVIAAETRMMEKVIPADPANQESQQSIVQQAGGVWFPDSAYKTAQAIKMAFVCPRCPGSPAAFP